MCMELHALGGAAARRPVINTPLYFQRPSAATASLVSTQRSQQPNNELFFCFLPKYNCRVGTFLMVRVHHLETIFFLNKGRYFTCVLRD